ncbi:response regulator [Rhizobium leguminosarum]|uniref:response regulator n=1 Tax=Rhizobium leguminosarum TaxID=384 RepID=UPI0021B12AEF|nr:response regulator [Rhizobium leguminosarum]
MTDSTDIVRRSTILIVDDEPPNVSLLERILKREGFTALISTTEPREALRLFREHPVDLVLLDLMMPVLDAATRKTGNRACSPDNRASSEAGTTQLRTSYSCLPPHSERPGSRPSARRSCRP